MCHPGGPKVIESLRDALSLTDDDVRLTWESLARVGNLSSASVLHVLEDTLRDRPPVPGTYGLMIAMGPGLLRRARPGPRDVMTSLWAFTALIVLVALERVAELVVSRRNAAWSLERGGRETGAGHYPFMVVLHTGFLAGALLEAWWRRPDVSPALAWSMFLVVLAAQALRWWCIATLGHRWNTRVIVVPGMEPVTDGPYRFLRHPNYVAVVLEGFALPSCTPAGSPPWSSRSRTRHCWWSASGSRTRPWRHCPPIPGPAVRDLVVAGGGPVGLAAALYAARAGLDVVVRDPRADPVDKACGEGLMPGAVADLTALGVELDGHPSRASATCGRRASPPLASATVRGAASGVRRCSRPCPTWWPGAGVAVERRPVVDVRQRGDHLLVDGEPTRYLIAADGLHSPTRRAAGLDEEPAALRRYGLRCHLTTAPWTSTVDVHWSSSAEAYVTPVAPRPRRGGHPQ